MTREDLFAAIGEVSEARLEKCESTTKRGGKRILLRCGLAAAVVAALAATVFAIPAVRNALFGGKAEMEQTGGIYGTEYGVEDRYYDDSYAVRLDIAVSPDAPDTIETYYIPMELEKNWTLCKGGYAFTNYAYFSWDNYDLGVNVQYAQTPAKCYTEGIPYDHLGVRTGTEVTETTLEHNELILYRFEVAPSEYVPYGEFYLYWSDGAYIFKLGCSASLTDEEVFSILDSLSPVEDVSQYCLPNDDSGSYEEVNPPFTRHDMPSYLPEGFELRMGEVENGCAAFYWEKGASSHIQYGQCTWDANADIYISWERDVEKCPREIVEIGGNTVTIFEYDYGYLAFWEADGFDYSLSISKVASYDARAELEKIIESIQPVEDITPYLKDFGTE